MRDVLAEWRPVVDEAIAELLPREIDDDYLTDFFGEATYGYDPLAVQEALADPIWELLDRGGKRWRAVVFLLLVEGFGEDPDEYLPYACIPEILHNGTIIVDDVEDGAAMRRGEPALHLEHGTDIALNAGNAMYFLPLKVITRNPGDLGPETRLDAYEMLMHELNRTHLGQGMDIHWHNEQEIRIGESEYLEMCACKTGCLGRIVARLAAIVTGQSDEVEERVARYAQFMSIAFQIGDDILDIEHTLDMAAEMDDRDERRTGDTDAQSASSNQSRTGDTDAQSASNNQSRTGDFGKEFGNDIREGKKTLMVIHAAETAPPADVARLEEILWAEENTTGEILEVVDILQEQGSIEYARERALELAAKAREEIAALDLEPTATENLQEFTRFVVEREA